MSDLSHVLILGDGLAGSCLASELSRRGAATITIVSVPPEGTTTDHGLRCTFADVVERHGLHYSHVYEGLRDQSIAGGLSGYCDVRVPLYALDYAETCAEFRARAGVQTVHDRPLSIDVDARCLYTEGGEYEYDFLVDCTGVRQWVRKSLGLPRAAKYYTGRTWKMPLTPVMHFPGVFTPKMISYCTDEDGYTEDLYQLGNDILCGTWSYMCGAEEETATRPGYLLDGLLGAGTLAHEDGAHVAITAEPILPLVRGNIAWLGDSAGQATPASSEGIRPIIMAAGLLAESIGEHGSLAWYEEQWLRRNLRAYVFHKVFKDRLPRYNRFFLRLKRYPKVYEALARNESAFVPPSVLLPSLPYFASTLLRYVLELRRYRRQMRVPGSAH